ncbi:MAG: hypothetical protein ABI402_18665 [Ferruginibacter sp.]
MITQQRKSHTSLGKIYFWTATIHKWYTLLQEDKMKGIIIDYLKILSDEKKITMYGFVLMLNHLHFIWQQHILNGKELPKGSFMKYTAHKFREILQEENKLHLYKVEATNKKHEIWQRDSLGVEIYSREVAQQKLDYINCNPARGKWSLAKDDISYYYSSAKFYETGVDDFGFLNNLYTVFDGL